MMMWRITLFDYQPLNCSETRELRVYTTIFDFDSCQCVSVARGSYTGNDWSEYVDTWMRTLPTIACDGDAACVVQCWFFERNKPKSTERRLIEKAVGDVAIVIDYFDHYDVFRRIKCGE
jgi:hypothetical protein